MSFDDFEKNKDFVYDLLGRERDKYDMTDKEKQELVISRLIDDEGKSKLKLMGIKKDKLKDNLNSLLKLMEKMSHVCLPQFLHKLSISDAKFKFQAK